MGRMMSPDSGVDQHPEDPQTWNLYSYGRNNPLTFVDPTGEYVCGSGITQSMCDNFQKTLDAAQNGANALKDKYGANSTQYTDAQRAIDAYGKEGVDNGVTLNLKEPSPGNAAGVDPNIGSAPKTSDNPLGIRINVNFGQDMFSGDADNAPDAAHEGSHVGRWPGQYSRKVAQVSMKVCPVHRVLCDVQGSVKIVDGRGCRSLESRAGLILTE